MTSILRPGFVARSVHLVLILGFVLAFGTPSVRALVINEIMYHSDQTLPDGTEDRRHEWIEIYNEKFDPIDLSGFFISRGVFYEFPAGTILRGKTYLVIAADPDLLAEEYGLAGVLGPWAPGRALDNGGETVAIANASGSELVAVSYNDRGKWPPGADGAGHTLGLLDPYLEVDDPDSWAPSVQFGGTPGASNFGGDVSFDELVKEGDIFRYFKGTTAPPSTWNQTGFSDGGWLSGPSGFGYGDGDDATLLSDMEDNYLSVFCRRQFTVQDVAGIEELRLRVTFDDGFAVYLNGVDVGSQNVSGRDFDDAATATVNDLPETVEFDLTNRRNLLVEGSQNVLAIQAHNTSIGSSDLSCIPVLLARRAATQGQSATAPVVVNEALLLTDGQKWVELYNTSSSAVDLSGFHITDDRSDLTKSSLPTGTTIPGRGFLTFSDTELGLDFTVAPPDRERVLIALVNPTGTRVVDAYAFEPTVFDRSEARFPDGDETVAPAADPTPDAANEVTVTDAVVINEIMYNSIHSGNPIYEFVELYNRSPDAIDLTGWQITGGVDFDFAAGTTIAGNGYLVVGRSPATLRTLYGLSESVVVGPTDPAAIEAFGRFSDRGERISVRDANDNRVDTVRYYDGGDWPTWPDAGGSSLELIDPWQDNSVGAAWDASDDSHKASTQGFGYTGTHAGGESEIHVALLDRGITIIDDLSVRRSGSETVSNPTFDSTTSSWRIEGNHIDSARTTNSEERINGAASLKIVATGRGDNKVNRIEADTSSLSGSLSISFQARWVVGSKGLLTRGYNSGMGRSHRLSVPRNLGTPGSVNSVTERQIAQTGSENLGPVISKVSQTPVIPGGSEPVVVTAKVVDTDGIAPGTVRLFWATNTPSGFTSVTMSSVGNDRYSATIPGQSTGTSVLFYVTAQDSEGQAGRYPVDHTERTHPFNVANAGSATAADRLYLIYRHDTAPSASRFSYRFIVDAGQESYLGSRRVLSNDMVHGSMVFSSDRIHYNSKARYSGSPWLRGGNGWRKSYRIAMPKDDPLWGRIRDFNMENHGRDGKERLSHHLIRHNNRDGIAAPYVIPWYAQWEFNDRVSDVYEHMPKPDNDYLSFWFPGDSDGDFFEIDDRFEFNDSGDKVSNQDARLTYPPYSSSAYAASDKENWRWFFNTRAKRDEDDFSNLISLAWVLDAGRTSDSRFDTDAERYMDVEAMLRIWAIRMNTDDWDTWGTNRGKNAYLYRRPSDGLWLLLPWDMELTYSNAGAFGLPSSASGRYAPSGKFPEVNRMINRPWVKRRFYGIMKEMVDHQFRSSFLSAWDSANKGAGMNLSKANPGDFVDDRRDHILPRISSVVYPQQQLTITTNGGNGFTVTEFFADLAGRAPVEVAAIRVVNDGRVITPEPEVEFSRTSMTAWTLDDVALVPGVNDLELLGLDTAGNVIDTTTIRITSATEWDPPFISNIDPMGAAIGETILIEGANFHTGLKVFFGAVEGEETQFNESSDPNHVSVMVPEGVSVGEVLVQIQNLDDQVASFPNFEVTPPLPQFIRGDANLDARVEIGDVITILLHAYRGEAVGCRQALDFDDSGVIETTDGVGVLDFLFNAGDAPRAPFPTRGRDLTPDALECGEGI